jgi:hypothetical protein
MAVGGSCSTRGLSSRRRFVRVVPNKRIQQTARIGFKRKVVAVVKLAMFVKRSVYVAWVGSTPQLMGRSVRRTPRESDEMP